MVTVTAEGLNHTFLTLAFHFLFLTNLPRFSHPPFRPGHQIFFIKAYVHSSNLRSAENPPVIQDPIQCLWYSSQSLSGQQAMCVFGSHYSGS